MEKAEKILMKHLNDYDLNFILHEKKQVYNEMLNAINEALSIAVVVNWLPYEEKNYDKFTELCKKDECMCFFDDGTECNYNDEHTTAIMTHFRQA